MLKASLVGFYDIKDENDSWGIIEKISKWGYKALEVGQFLSKGDISANLKKLSDMNFSVLAVAAGLEELQNNLDEIISRSKAIQVKYVCCYWTGPQSFEHAVEIAKIFNQAGEKLRGEGLILCYHNHDHEFRTSFNGVRYFDILMTLTSPENLSVNLDIGWASVAGENVPELIRRLNNRIKLMHFKDFYNLNDRNSFTALGTGKVQIQELIAEADKIGVEYITVEQDTLHTLNADDTVLLSYLTLKESGLVE